MHCFRGWLTVLLVWIPCSGQAQTSSLATVQESGARSKRINIVYLSEGYTSAQMGTFATNVQTATSYLFSREPWNRYQSYCNVYRIEVASNQSGTDNGAGGGLRDTYFGTGFYIASIPQNNSIGTTGTQRAYSLLNNHVPEYDIPIVLINDSKYGGSGGPIAVVTTNSLSPQILEHELGHSFAKLTDEYDEAYSGYPAIEFPNATTKTQRSEIRWKAWIDSTTALPSPEGSFLSGYQTYVGLFEGANYRATGWYRPHDNALMRSLNREPGSVTREAIILSYYEKVGLIDASSPSSASLKISTRIPLSFSLTLKAPSTGPALSVEWRLDNTALAGQSSSTLNLVSSEIGNGTHTLKAIVRDPTPWVRRDPTDLLLQEKSWTLTLSGQTDPPQINAPLPPSRVLTAGMTLSLDATASGPGPITYRWLKSNVPLKPAVTSPSLNVGPVSLASAGTYTVEITNPGGRVTHSCQLAVVDTTRLVSKVVVAVGGTATISFPASRNLPPVTWFFGGNSIANGGRYANAATAALQIKNLITSDTGGYVFETGDYTNSPVIKLQVVTGKPNYAGQSGSLPTGIVGASYSQSLPLPADVLLTPNSFRSTSLPRGLSIHRKTGLILGTPTTASADQVLGDEITFSVGNEFGTIPFKIRLLIKPLPPGVEGSFGGNVYIGSQLGGSTGGRMTITVGSSGAYSGQAVIGTETLPVRGIVRTNTPNDSTASGSIVLKPKHLSQALNLPFTINTASDLDDATANLTDSSSFSLWRNRWAIPGQTDPFAGYHTFALSETIGSNAPKGRGFGSVTIDSNGNTSAKGKLADGSSFTTASYLSPEGGILVYQTLYATAIKGSFIAILDLDEGSPAFFSSKTISNWFRPADPRSATIARAYPSGFGPELLGATGGLYQPPAETVIPMELGLPSGTPPSNAQLIFEQTLGNDPLPVDADVSLNIRAGGDSAVNLPNPKAVTFKLNPADGRFSGKYRTKDADPRPPASRPAISRSVDYAGIIIRDGSVLRGIGYLQRPDLPKADGSTTPSTSPIHSGPVALVPAP